MKKFRVVQWGLGAMGSGMARLVLEKDGLELVGGIDMRPDYVGKDLGEVLGGGRRLGVTVTNDPASVLDKSKVDLVVIATTSWTKEQMPDLRKILSAGINCISIAEEMAAPEAQSPELAAEIDALAKKHGVSILGTGVNPGFVLDLLVVTLSGVCHHGGADRGEPRERPQPLRPDRHEDAGRRDDPRAVRGGSRRRLHRRARRLPREHPDDQRRARPRRDAHRADAANRSSARSTARRRT